MAEEDESLQLRTLTNWPSVRSFGALRRRTLHSAEIIGEVDDVIIYLLSVRADAEKIAVANARDPEERRDEPRNTRFLRPRIPERDDRLHRSRIGKRQKRP